MPRAEMAVRNRLTLAHRILEVHYSQPATALWRVFEAEVVLEHLRGIGRGLDLGCGDGALATILFARTPDVRWTGLDIDGVDIYMARRRGVYATVYIASATAIPEKGNAFDLIFSNSALEHMPGLHCVLGEVARVLKPGGRFVFTVPDSGFHSRLLWARVLRTLGFRAAAEQYTRHLDRRVAHLNYLSAGQWAAALAAHGLTVTVTKPYLSRRALVLWETLANATGGLAFVAAGGRMTPRQIQQAVGAAGGRNTVLGRLAFVALLPVLLAASLERAPQHFGCLYVEAVRTDATPRG